MNVRPKKALGQHFLTDLSIADRIAATLDEYRGLPVVEVGPGMGVLTRFLLERGHDVTVVELDGESVEYLRANMPQLDGRIVAEDFLKLDLGALVPGDGKFCLIGNYPYNISSQIFFHALEWKDRIVCVSGMLQREVARRLAAPEGGKERGILSVLLQAWYDVEYLFTVDEHVFNPPPKVKSAVIRMTRNGVTDLGCDERLFKRIVKAVFNQRRKMLRVSLRQIFSGTPARPEFYTNEVMTKRPEQLSVAQFVELTNMVEAELAAVAEKGEDKGADL